MINLFIILKCMEKNNSELKEIKNILIWFISEQKDFNNKIEKKINNLESFNEKQKIFNEKIESFNEEQKAFNEKIEKKIDKAQYFLEETIATNTKMFFEEQIEMKTEMREMEDEIKYLKNDLIELTLKVNHIFKNNLIS